MTKLLIAGATGLVGSHALKLALIDQRIEQIIVISRRPLVVSHAKLKNYVFDFDSMNLHEQWSQVDAGICALGTTKRETTSPEIYHKIDVEYPVAIAKALKKAGARAFAHVSSVGASPSSLFNYLKLKGEAEEKLAHLGFESLTIVRPSFIKGARERPRFNESLFHFFFQFVQPLLPKKWHAVSAEIIAKAMIEAVIAAKPGIEIREYENM